MRTFCQGSSGTQRGRCDGAQAPADVVATLDAFVRLKTSGSTGGTNEMGLTYANPIDTVLTAPLVLTRGSGEDRRVMPAITLEQAQAAKRAVLERYGGRAEVVGVGITRTGDGDYAVKVNLSHRPDEDLPSSVDGVPIVSEVVGQIRAR